MVSTCFPSRQIRRVSRHFWVTYLSPSPNKQRWKRPWISGYLFFASIWPDNEYWRSRYDDTGDRVDLARSGVRAINRGQTALKRALTRKTRKKLARSPSVGAVYACARIRGRIFSFTARTDVRFHWKLIGLKRVDSGEKKKVHTSAKNKTRKRARPEHST